MNQEQIDSFCDATADLDFLRAGVANAYIKFRHYIFAALKVILSELPEVFSDWHENAVILLKSNHDNARFSEMSEQVISYRKTVLHLSIFSPSCKNNIEAATVLFMFAFEKWEDTPELLSQPSIIQGIDEFSTLVIEFFGKADLLVEIIKKHCE